MTFATRLRARNDTPGKHQPIPCNQQGGLHRMVTKHGPVRSWIIDDTGLPKKGRHSVGTARQYCGQLGKVDNSDVCCQYLEETGFTSALRGDPDRSRCHCALQETEPFRRRLITL
jgi:DDE superfamily endonuclease